MVKEIIYQVPSLILVKQKINSCKSVIKFQKALPHKLMIFEFCIQSQMFVKKIKSINNKRAKADAIEVDCSMRLISIYNQPINQIQIISTVMLLDYFLSYRKLYNNNRQYSLKQTLKSQTTLHFNNDENFLMMKFSETNHHTITLCVGFLAGNIVLYNAQNGHKLKSLFLNFPFVNLKIINQSIYVTSYNLQLYFYQNLQPLLKEGKVSLLIYQENNTIYEDNNGNISNEKGEVIFKNFEQKIIKKQSSYEEYLQLQAKDNYYPLVYEVSQSKQFITMKEKNGDFLLLSKAQGWKIKYRAQQKPIINPFIKKGIVIIAYIINDNSIQIQTITGEILLSIKDFKHQIRETIWVGPIHLLIIFINSDVYYQQMTLISEIYTSI